MTERVEHVEHSGCRCRKCRCVRFTSAVEQLLRDGENDVVRLRTVGSLSHAEYALLLESSIRELHEQLVLR